MIIYGTTIYRKYILIIVVLQPNNMLDPRTQNALLLTTDIKIQSDLLYIHVYVVVTFDNIKSDY